MDEIKINEIISRIPLKPGVYLMKDITDRIIYIGKSRKLQKRVKSYFAKYIDSPKTRAMVALIASVDFMVTETETEALILENNLIKKYKPKYNILLKDSKTHPYIRVSLSDRIPRLEKVRKVNFKDGNQYFGPFPGGYGLDKVINLLSRNHLLCTNRKKIGKSLKPCLKFELGLCSGVCIGAINETEYRKEIQKVVDTLSGKTLPDFAGLKIQLSELVKEFRYEEAAELRDTLAALKGFFEAQHVEFVNPVNYDFWGMSETSDCIIYAVFFIRAGKLMRSRTIKIDKELDASSRSIFSSVLRQFYETNIIPSRIYSSIEPSSLASFLEICNNKSDNVVYFKIPQKGKFKKLLDMANLNADEVMRNTKSIGPERISDAVLDLNTRLRLSELPNRIECVDISHIQGVDPVASLVVFNNGIPMKSEYRLFHIKESMGGDDPASIGEVTRRRFSRQISSGGKLCDLYIVDGGLAQVRAACIEVEKLGLKIPIYGLAKREELLVLSDGTEIKLPFSSLGMRMIIKLRNEAHRFANTFQKKTHTKRTIRSSLLDLPGVGPITLQKLIWQFGSIKSVGNLTPEEVNINTGINIKVCRIIIEALKKDLNEK